VKNLVVQDPQTKMREILADLMAVSRVMRAAVSIPAVAAASVSHSAAVGGSVVGVVGLL